MKYKTFDVEGLVMVYGDIYYRPFYGTFSVEIEGVFSRELLELEIATAILEKMPMIRALSFNSIQEVSE